MSKVNTNNFEKGSFIIFREEICQIVDFQHVNPGKGSAFVRTRLKNIKNGKVLEFTFKAGEDVEGVTVNTAEMQYLYKEGSDFIFMNQETFEQIGLDENVVGEMANYMKEGESYPIMMHEGGAVGIRFPKKVVLAVTEASEAVRGDTATSAKKTVTLETGVQVLVPMFVKQGDRIVVNTETGDYVEREG